MRDEFRFWSIDHADGALQPRLRKHVEDRGPLPRREVEQKRRQPRIMTKRLVGAFVRRA